MQSPFLDRLALKIESGVSHYTENRGELYRPFLKLCLGVYVFDLCFSLVFRVPSVYDLEPRYAVWLVGGLVLDLALIVMLLVVRKRIEQRSPTAITLLALFLLLNLLGIHVVLFGFGLVVALNQQFRSTFQESAPVWYRNLTSSLD